MKSALRRHHYRRLQRKRRWYWFGPEEAQPQPDMTAWTYTEAERLGKLANTPHPCSRPGCCGNLRRAFGETIQERRAPRVTDWGEGSWAAT